MFLEEGKQGHKDKNPQKKEDIQHFNGTLETDPLDRTSFVLSKTQPEFEYT